MSLALLDKVKKYYGDRLILDIEKIEIMLKSYKGALLIVSHDRKLLDEL